MVIAGSLETRVNTFTAGDQYEPSVTALKDGGWVVTWTSVEQDGSWQGVYQQAYDANGTARGTETQVNTYSTNQQYEPSVTALADGGWVVTWASSWQDGSGSSVYQQAYNADGTVRGTETRVNTYSTNQQYEPSVTALADGGWVVTWSSNGQDGSGSGVYQQAYNANGTARGTETQVNTYSTDDQYLPSVTALADGGWVVTWTSAWQDGFAGSGVYQQAYDANGTARGTETQVNTYSRFNQGMSSVTALKDGGWVVTWASQGQDGSGLGVYQQAYNANGTARGTETQVNTYSTNDQFQPSVTALKDGGWVVTWISYGQDGSAYGVYQQAYDAGGTARGTETQVNTYSTGYQYQPSVTALEDGGWVVTWASNGQDGSGYGVYQRIFWLNDAPTSGVIVAQTATVTKPFNSPTPQIPSPIRTRMTRSASRRHLPMVIPCRPGWHSILQRAPSPVRRARGIPAR